MEKRGKNGKLVLPVIILIVLIVFILFLIELKPKIKITGYATYEISSCQDLSQGNTYTLTSDVSSEGTCFNITGDNIIINCQGHLITYSQSVQGSAIAVQTGYGYNNTAIKNCRIVDGGSGSYAIDFSESSYNNITNNTITASTYTIYFSNSINNNIINNTIKTTGLAGAIAFDATSNSLFYNNIINVTKSTYVTIGSGSNLWNITKVTGTNKIGGTNLGGNYYANSTGTGFSEACTDTNKDGICDTTKTHDANNIDYLPLTLNQDNIAPNIAIVYPPNNTNTSNTGLDINYTFSSDAQACWYTNDTYSYNASLTCGTNITSVIWAEGIHNVTIWANDSSNNQNSSSVRFTIDTIYPLISYGQGTEVDYANKSLPQIGFVYVNVSVTEINEANITFKLYNSTAEVNTTIFTTAIRVINWTSLSNDIYKYNVTLTDRVNHQNTTPTRTITLDTTAPVISFSCSPDRILTGEILTCSCSATDSIDAVPSLSYTEKPSTSNSGVFITSCTATDDAGNSEISYVSYTVEAIGRGGGGGGGGKITQVSNIITETQLAEGKIIDITQKDIIEIKTSAGTHTVKIKDKKADKITIEIYSEKITSELSIGEEKKFDLDNDGYYDLKVKFEGYFNDKIRLNFVEIKEKTAEPEPSTEEIGETGQVPEQETKTNLLEKIKSNLKIIISIIAVLIIIIIVLVITIKSAKTRR